MSLDEERGAQANHGGAEEGARKEEDDDGSLKERETPASVKQRERASETTSGLTDKADRYEMIKPTQAPKA